MKIEYKIEYFLGNTLWLCNYRLIKGWTQGYPSEHIFGVSKTTFQACKTPIWIASISFLGLWALNSLFVIILYSSCHKSGISLLFSKIVMASLWMHTACRAQRLENHPVLSCSVPYLPAKFFGAVPTLHGADNPGTTFLWKSQQRRSHSVLKSWLEAQNAHLSSGTQKSFSVSLSICSHRSLTE